MQPTIKPTAVDWAKLAVIIDCEGNIHINKKGRPANYQLQVNVGMKDFIMLEWCLARFGGSIYKNTGRRDLRGPKYAPAKRWRIQSQEASDILARCLNEYIIKRKQAEIAIQFWNVYSKRIGSRVSETVRMKSEELRLELRALTKRGPRSGIAPEHK